MSNNQVPRQRLPDELIAEVFQNKTLSSEDLVNCSLVSRQHVDSVNRSLYEHLPIELNADPIGGYHVDDDLDRYDYSTRSWKLLRTLLDHPRLAKYVKELEFDLVVDDERGPGKTGNETKKPLALSTFLRLGSNVKNVILNESWSLRRTTVDIIKEHKNVTGLSVFDMHEEEEEYCAQNLQHLKCLSITELDLGRTSTDGNHAFEWKSLERLDLFEGVKTIIGFSSFSASSSTLRSLLVPLTLALKLDYSKFSVLHKLHLVDDDSDDNYDGGQDCYSSAENFWTSLCGSHSLHTLVFSTAPKGFSDGYEQALFTTFSGPRNAIPSLRIIRIERGVQLDRANSLLSGPLAETLQTFVVPSYLQGPFATAAEVNKLRAFAVWCETRGVELVVADQPLVRWTLLRKRISLTYISLFVN